MRDYIDEIKKCVLSELETEDVSVALFGSAADGVMRQGSDIDIAVLPEGLLVGRQLAVLREKLEELNVPYKVDVVDFSWVAPDFREFALKKVVWWKKTARA